MNRTLNNFELAIKYYYFSALIPIVLMFKAANVLPSKASLHWHEMLPWDESIADKIPTWTNNAIYLINTPASQALFLSISFISAFFLLLHSECESKLKTASNSTLVITLIVACTNLATTLFYPEFYG